MNLRAALEQTRDKLIQSAASLFEYDGDFRPSIDWGDSESILLSGKHYFLNFKEGKIQLNMSNIVNEFMHNVKNGYERDDRRFLVYIVSKPLTSLYQYLTDRSVIEKIAGSLKYLQSNVENGDHGGIRKTIRDIGYQVTNFESFSMAGRNLIEKELGVFDEKSHELLHELNQREIVHDWEHCYNTLMKINETNIRKSGDKDLKHKLNFLGKSVLVYYETGFLTSDIVGNKISNGGASHFRKIVKDMDDSMVNSLLDELNKKFHPNMESFEDRLSELLMATYGGWISVNADNGSINFKYRKNLLDSKVRAIM